MDLLIGFAVISLMGVCLGMIGAGGSLLAVPALVYLFRVEPTLATTYASIIVGITASAGAVRSLLTKSIDLRSVLWFGIPCLVGASLARFCLLMLIPEVIELQAIVLTRDTIVMLIFSATMLLAGLSMLNRPKREPTQSPRYEWLIPVGLVVGIVTGIVGAGGGFLILPSLILIAGLSVPQAIGTSLTIIAIKSIASLLGDLTAGAEINLLLIALLCAVAIPGVMTGRWLTSYVNASILKYIFGMIMCGAGALMGIHQLFIIFEAL